MGFEGHLRFFSPNLPANSVLIVNRLLDTLTTQKIWAASRFKDRTKFFLEVHRGTANMEEEPDEEYEFIKEPIRTNLAYLLRSDKNCFLGIIASDQVDPALAHAINRIDSKIRGDWSAGTSAYNLEIGPHECIESVSEVKHFGHAEISLTSTSPGSPLDWPACRRTVLELPEVKAFAKRLEPILGEVKTCVYWDG